jgi:cell division inhibitor SulA
MNALLKSEHNPNLHHWKLWVSPNQGQKSKLSTLPSDEKDRVLMMHPKDKERMIESIEMAIESGLYEEISLPMKGLSQKEQGRLQLRAIRHSTSINWTDKAPRLNRASQLSLI